MFSRKKQGKGTERGKKTSVPSPASLHGEIPYLAAFVPSGHLLVNNYTYIFGIMGWGGGLGSVGYNVRA